MCPEPNRPLSGYQRRKARVAAGLPRYTEKEALSRKANDRRRRDERYREHRALVDGIKLERGCADCGYTGHPAALDFDHLPGVLKEADIARAVTWRCTANLLAEIAKCEVVCANCHRIRTQDRGGIGVATSLSPQSRSGSSKTIRK